MTTNDSESVQGLVATSEDPLVLEQAVERAFEYRGDVTVTLRGTTEPVVGYIYDRTRGATLAEWTVRIMTADDRRERLSVGDISRIEFSGRDTAAGRSFERWIKRYVERKLAGESADIESEPLHD